MILQLMFMPPALEPLELQSMKIELINMCAENSFLFLTTLEKLTVESVVAAYRKVHVVHTCFGLCSATRPVQAATSAPCQHSGALY